MVPLPTARRIVRPLIVTVALALALGCGAAPDADSDLGDADASDIERVDVAGLSVGEAPAGHSVYHLDITRRSGEQFAFNRDLTGDELTALSFSGDGTGPTVELRFSDATITLRLLVLEIDLGIIDGGTVYAEHTRGPGAYPFSRDRPAIRVTTDNRAFDTRTDGSVGTLEIIAWPERRGDALTGTVEGRLYGDGGDWTDVRGWFQLVMPRDIRPESNALCDLVLQDCVAWEACYWFDNPPGPACRRPGAVGAGSRCHAPDECLPSMMCRSNRCRRICDVRTPECNIDYECNPWFGEAGFCAP